MQEPFSRYYQHATGYNMYIKLAIISLLLIPLFDNASEQNDIKDYIDRTYGTCKTKTPSPPPSPRDNSDKK